MDSVEAELSCQKRYQTAAVTVRFTLHIYGVLFMTACLPEATSLRLKGQRSRSLFRRIPADFCESLNET